MASVNLLSARIKETRCFPVTCSARRDDIKLKDVRFASLDANQAGWQPLKECQDLAALQLPANNHLPGGINAMNLKDRLGDIETDCRNRLHGASESWEPQQRPHPWHSRRFIPS
jgi:hypothetical protein